MAFTYGACIGKDTKKIETLKKTGCDFRQVNHTRISVEYLSTIETKINT